MPVVCPGCGTLVKGGARVCPACHHVLRETTEDVSEEASDGGRWCGSCGSPIPVGHDACLECGMPVDGAFDDDAFARFGMRRAVQVAGTERDAEQASLISALPPAPKSGEGVASRMRPQYTRMLLAAALAALLLVGSTTLYVTKPWGVEPAPIQVRDDADISMEGFPGERSHLTAQDLFAEQQYREKVAGQKADLDEAYRQMGEVCNKLDESYERIKEYLSSGYRRQGDSSTSDAIALNSEANKLYERFENMDPVTQDLKDLRERYVVLARYLKGASLVLSQAWVKADQAKGSPEAVFLVRSTLEGEGNYSYEEWISLFKNAYGSNYRLH